MNKDLYQTILGLDISTTTIGISIINKCVQTGKITLDVCKYYKPPKDGSIFERLIEVKQFILNLLEAYDPHVVVIEDYARFMAGSSGAATIIPLAIFNTTIGLTVFENTGNEPILMNVNTIRKWLKTGEERLKKEDIPEAVAYHLKIDFPYEMTKKGKIAVESYDKADSAAVALAYLKSIEPKIVKPKKSRAKKVMGL
jgi:Holliday junction resolvasome RuvABC endonuclease subunit